MKNTEQGPQSHSGSKSRDIKRCDEQNEEHVVIRATKRQGEDGGRGTGAMAEWSPPRGSRKGASTHTMTLTSLDLLLALHVTTGRPRQQSTYTNGNHDSQSYLACENTSALKQPKLKETSSP